MMKAAGVPPLAGLGLIAARDVDGVEAVILPYGGRQESDLEFLCRLICHDDYTSVLVKKGRETVSLAPCWKPSGPKIPRGAASPGAGKTHVAL